MHRPQGELRKGLILGFGAGAAGRLLRDQLGFERVVGIDLDPVHLSIADGFFECSEGCQLLQPMQLNGFKMVEMAIDMI